MNAWEQRKFSSIAKIYRGLTYKPTDVQDTGVRVLRSSNIDGEQFVLKSDDVFVSLNTINIEKVRNGDILITAANGSSRLVGKHAIIHDITSPTVHGGFMLIARTSNPQFVNALMSSNWYKKFIMAFVLGGNGAIGNLRKSELENKEVFIADEKEQKRIGDFFRSLDRLLTLHQRRFK